MSATPDMSDREGLAAEYVLGSLPLPERIEAERLMRGDADFAALVADWQARLSALDDSYVPVPPPADLLGRIEARLFPRPEPQAGPRRWLAILGGLAVAATALFLALAYLPVGGPEPVPVATLTGEGQPLVVAALYDADDGRLTLRRTAGPPAATGQDYEMWVIPEGAAPISVGVLRDDDLQVPLADLPAGTTLAITLEQEGGSPTGQAQGPLLVAAVIGG